MKRFDMFYRGRYTRPAGLIYDSFDEAICVVPRKHLPLDWPRYVGTDSGPVHTAAIWYAQDPNTGWLYAYREYQTTTKHSAAQNIKDFLKPMITIKTSPHESSQTTLKRLVYAHAMDERYSGQMVLLKLPGNIQN